MIYLGYDPARRVTLARYLDTTIIINNSLRAIEILNGLCDVAQNLLKGKPVSLGKNNGVEVVIMIITPWMQTVQYSDQAWNDLLSVQENSNDKNSI